MENCGSNVFDLPASVNRTLFFSLISQGNVLAAIQLLPPEWIRRLNTNSSGPGLMPVKKNCSIPSPKAETLFAADVTLIAVYSWILLLTSVAGILGNALVVLVYSSRPKELTPYKWTLLHLGACDLCFSILQVIGAIPSLQQSHWSYGNIGCKVLKGSVQLGSMVAIGTLLVIALERYIAVLKPLQRSNRGRRTLLALAVVWGVSILSVIPACIANRFNEKLEECQENWDHSGLTKTYGYIYGYYMLVVFFLLPVVCIAFSYLKIAKFLLDAKDGNQLLYGNLSPAVLERRKKEDRRRIRVMLCLVIVFSVCVLPRRIFWVVVQHIEISALPVHSYYGLVYAGMLPYPFHVAVNPIVYSLIDARFRQSVKLLFTPFLNITSCWKSSQKQSENIAMKQQPKRKETVSTYVPSEKSQ